MWCRKRLDIGWGDLAWAAARSLWPGGNPGAAERRFCDGESVACLSVRSSFDLLLTALRLPAGSEVMLSAITVPGMVQIARAHGLVPVPIDLDPATAAPDAASLERALTPASKLLVVAHLFGARADLDPLIELARRHDLLVVEDCAQVYSGPPEPRGTGYGGDPRCDLSLFSFGSIKTATALGGALAVVRSPELRREIRRVQAGWPRQRRSDFAARAFKSAALKTLSYRWPYAALVRAMKAIGRDHDRWINQLVKGFPGPRLLERIRRRPSSPLLDLLDRRLRRFDTGRLRRRQERGRQLLSALLSPPPFANRIPGHTATDHDFWVFPITCPKPERLRRSLLREGFDATRGNSLIVVPTPPGRSCEGAPQAEEMLEHLLFVPLYPEISPAEVDRLAHRLRTPAET